MPPKTKGCTTFKASAKAMRLTLISAVKNQSPLYSGSYSKKVGAGCWKEVAFTCNESEEFCRSSWKQILQEHNEEFRGRVGSSGSGSSSIKTHCPNYEKLMFLREGTPRRSSSSVEESVPFRENLTILSPPQPAKRKRTPSDALNEKLGQYIDSVKATLERPVSVEYALGCTIGQKLHDLPDGQLKRTWRNKVSTMLSELENDIEKSQNA